VKTKFIEIMIAPEFDAAFVEWARGAKPQMRLLQQRERASREAVAYKTVSGGILAQTRKPHVVPTNLDKLLASCDAAASPKVGVVTQQKAAKEQLPLFAFAIASVNFAKSNAICIVREYAPQAYQLLAVGAGQPNRVDSLQRLAIPKAIDNLKAEHPDDAQYDSKNDLSKCVLVSDGFFPFDDSVVEAARWGIKTCIQPGGSTNDQKVIEAADRQGMCMVMTGERYFTH
jgi:phosphoribosylaminoimidazolecarboxamide formyltransferase/IMP cyclohydrolase